MSAGPPFCLLVNPSAGGGRVRGMLPEVERLLDQRQLEHRTVLTESLEHAVDEARRASDRGERVAVMSGDGLIGQVGGALAGTATPLGVLPGGRGNDFARAVGIPSELGPAADILEAGLTREIDVGEVNGRRFLCIASCGFDSDANRIANEARFVRGRLVYLYAALRALGGWKPARFTLDLDGARHEFTGYGVAFANSSAYGGGMYVAPDASLDDGILDVVWMSDTSKRSFLLGTLPKVFEGRHVENDEVSVERAAEAQVSADRSFAVYADGDHIADLPATIRVLPRALTIIAPPAE